MDTVTLLIVALVCLVVGFLIGILLNTLRGEREPAAEKRVEEVTRLPSTQVEVARFYRDRPGEPLLIEMEGRTFGNSIELNTPQREILEDLIIELRNFLGQLSVFASAGSREPVGSSLDAPYYGEAKPAFSTSDYNPAIYSPAPGGKASQAAAAVSPFGPAKSIVGQIDDILQDKLIRAGLLNQSIHLSESANQGAVVMIGRNVYPGIDDVPDPDIKELIRQAVNEWEQLAK